MRRIELPLLVVGVMGMVALSACSSSISAKPDGGAGTGGHAGGTAGTGGGGAGGGGAGGATTDAGADASTDAPDGSVLSLSAQRGQYLVKSVLGCAGCHTPQLAGGGGADNSKLLSGVDCFSKDTGTGCLASANLTPDDTGIGALTDQQVKDAFTKGIHPGQVDGGTQYLFAQMPYYQFSNVTDDDASAIVAYLRTVAPVVHAAPAGTGTFATRPTAPQWSSVPLASYPVAAARDGGTTDAGGADAGATDAGGGDASATDAATDTAADVAQTDASATDASPSDAGAPITPNPANGRYLAALMCATCHTVNASVDGGATTPLMLDMAKLLQGGKEFTTTLTVAVDGGTDARADAGNDAGADAATDAGTDAATTTTISKKIQSANLTPDTTGLKTWTAAQIVTAIKTGKDEAGRSICSPMRPFPGLTEQDAVDIATYLLAIPPVANALTETCE